MIGYLWALASVILVSAAQLMMRYTMMQVGDWSMFLAALLTGAGWVWWLPAGILCYALSMLCWLFALRRLPLNQAYPLLSLSYVLVCALAIGLPLFDERLNLGKLLGMALIVMGLLVIYPPRRRRRKP
ncbi:4-amino-4-deoxy-L-arabinose-phosphoundecaprenol flippase subunit ArnF [Edwardsiella tarda]|uniref:4-amino-4-deoxy-L-arabinose-phosphoundecaprenol flippase subunit ArnF n=1 Tax=Edwardsiella tarda TaxID=636 RepID=UPI003D303BA8